MKDKKLIKYIIIILVLFVGLILIETNKKKTVDWTPSFINTDKNPYGTYIAFDLLKNVFPNRDIYVSRLPISNELGYIVEEDERSSYMHDKETIDLDITSSESYLFINNNFGIRVPPIFEDDKSQSFGIDKLDIKNLLSFVEKGNNTFISAERMSHLLLDTLGLKIETGWDYPDTVFVFNELKTMEYAFNSMNGIMNYFEKKDSANTNIKVLAESKKSHKPVFIKVKHGKGYFYLNTLPVAFSNIELLKVEKYEFAFTCLSYLPKTNDIIWDEYQKQGRIGEYSMFRVIWNHPAMLWAYYIILVTALLFMLFRSKRTQRIIPVITPPGNTSLEFLDTISNLYYCKEAYESIVEKRHNYFLDLIRSRYYLRTEIIDSEFIKALNLKSGVKAELLEAIFDLHQKINTLPVSSGMLLEYNSKLEEFYRKMK